jgi:hypothetical protein
MLQRRVRSLLATVLTSANKILLMLPNCEIQYESVECFRSESNMILVGLLVPQTEVGVAQHRNKQTNKKRVCMRLSRTLTEFLMVCNGLYGCCWNLIVVLCSVFIPPPPPPTRPTSAAHTSAQCSFNTSADVLSPPFGADKSSLPSPNVMPRRRGSI